jgi:hypothetical protein
MADGIQSSGVPNIKPVNFWFEYPIHRLDTTGELANLGPEGSLVGNLTKTGNFSTPESRRTAFDNAYDALSIDEDLQITVNDLAEYIGSRTEDREALPRMK